LALGVALACASAVVSAPTLARAQVAAVREPQSRDGILGRFGVAAASAGLGADDPEVRRRSVERLADMGTKEALTALVDALEPGVLRMDARVMAIRALSRRVDDEDVRSALAREVLQAGGARREWARSSFEPARVAAALVLARSGHDRALAALGVALREGGAAAAAAREALLAYPPARFEPLFGMPTTARQARIDGRTVAPAVLSFFGDLGDARALPLLRAALGASSRLVRAEAALSLAKLGDAAALTYAAEPAVDEPALQIIRAQVLTRFADPRAIEATIALLADPRTRREGLALVRRSPDPRYAAALTGLVGDAPELAGDIVAAIGECATLEGAAALVARLDDRATAPAAALALGRSAREPARDALRALVAEAAAQPHGLRAESAALAGIVHALALGESVPGLTALLFGLVGDASPAAAELAAFGLVALGTRDVRELLESKPSRVREAQWWGAIARGALARGESERAELAHAYLERIKTGGRDAAPELEAAAAVGLLDRATARLWPTSELTLAARRGGASAPLATRELARRDDGSLRADVDALLTGSDPAVRLNATLGLADDVEPSTVARLVASSNDDDAWVRAAAVRSLSHRQASRATQVLQRLAAWDPDSGVRALARIGAAGRKLPDLTLGAGDVGVTVIATFGDVSAPNRHAWTARITRPDGLLVPVVVPTGGWLIVPGIGAGASSVTLFEPAAAAAAPALAVPPPMKKPSVP